MWLNEQASSSFKAPSKSNRKCLDLDTTCLAIVRVAIVRVEGLMGLPNISKVKILSLLKCEKVHVDLVKP